MASLSDFLSEWNSQADYVVARTSGSTGVPKEIRLAKSDMVASARATNAFFGIDRRSVLAIPLSMDYIAGKMMAVRAIVAGCRLVVLPVSNDIDLDGHVDLLSVVPSQARRLLERGIGPSDVGALLVGGAGVDRQLEHDIVSAGFNAWLGFGMTETCSHVALRRFGATDGLYRAMPGISFETDSRGCLVIVGDGFSWRRLVTNDVVSLDSDVSFRWLGRADNVVNSGGIKVMPEEVEDYIRERVPEWFPEFYVTGAPSERWGEVVALVFAGAESDVPRVRECIGAMSWRRGHRPVVIKWIAELPRTESGKIRRPKL